MTDKKKLKARVDMFKSMIDSGGSNYFSTDYIMKMLNINKNEIRKYKIWKIFNE